MLKTLTATIVTTAALLAWTPHATAAPLTVTDGTSSITVDPTLQAGLFDWSVEGVNQLNQQWYWIGRDASAEMSLDTFVLNSASAIGNQILLSYSQDGLGVDVTYTLTGTGNESRIDERIILTNQLETTQTLRFFEYTDLDLNGNSQGDFASGDVTGILQSKKGTSVLVSSLLLPNAFQIGPFSDIRDLLNDALVTNLDNSGNPSGPDDLTQAFQWNLALGPLDQLTIEKSKQLDVPEPVSLVLVLAGVAGALRRRLYTGHQDRT